MNDYIIQIIQNVNGGFSEKIISEWAVPPPKFFAFSRFRFGFSVSFDPGLTCP